MGGGEQFRFSLSAVEKGSLGWLIVMFYDSLLHLPKWVVESSFVFLFRPSKKELQFRREKGQRSKSGKWFCFGVRVGAANKKS